MVAVNKLSSQEESLARAMRDAQAGDATAYRELLEAVRVLMKAYIARILGRMGKSGGGTEDDLVQEVLLAIHQKRHTYDSRELFLPWLFAIARYKAIDFGRREKRKGVSIELSELEEVLSSPVFTENSTSSDLEVLISSLPAKSKGLLQMVKLEGLSIAEAAAKTQMSESAVKVTIHRAMKLLRKNLRKEKM